MIFRGSFIFKDKYYPVTADKNAAGLQNGVIRVFEKQYLHFICSLPK